MERRAPAWRAAIWVVVGLTYAAVVVELAGQTVSPTTPENTHALVDAAQARDVGAVLALLEIGEYEVDAPQPDGATALAWASHWDDLGMAAALIRAGADVNAANELGVTPLMLASANGSAEMVGALVQAGADPGLARPSGETALMMASRSGSVAAVAKLIARGADVDAATAAGRTALMWAAAERHPDVGRTLIDAGADVHARTAVVIPSAPAHSYVNTHVKPASRFIAANPRGFPRDSDGDPSRPEGGFTPLLYAVMAGNLDSVEALLAAGVSVDEAGPDGMTALMLALIKRHEPLALLLFEKGANVHSTEPGYAALHLASATGQLEAAEAMLVRGVDPNVRLERPQRLTDAFESGVFRHPGSGRLTQIGSTPLIVAAKSADAPMMRLLAAHGADPSLTTNDGTTVLMVAAGLGKRAAQDMSYFDWTEPKAIAALAAGLLLGINVNAANVHGETALHAAAYQGANRVIEFLVESGADIDVTNAAEQTALRVADGHLLCCTSFIRFPSTVARLRELGADPEAGIQLAFGMTGASEDVTER